MSPSERAMRAGIAAFAPPRPNWRSGHGMSYGVRGRPPERTYLHRACAPLSEEVSPIDHMILWGTHHFKPLVPSEVAIFPRHRLDTRPSHAIHVISVRAGIAAQLLTPTLES